MNVADFEVTFCQLFLCRVVAEVIVVYVEQFGGSCPKVFICFVKAVFAEFEIAALSRGAVPERYWD